MLNDAHAMPMQEQIRIEERDAHGGTMVITGGSAG